MELKWQQAFHSVRPLPLQETGRATGEGWMGKASERVHAQAHVNAVTPKHACASTGTHICLFGPIGIYITITTI